MIPFLRRKKEEPIYLDCYTASHFAYNHAKIDRASNYMPAWWKSQHRVSPNGQKTIKYCNAVRDYYAAGIVIPLWGEVEIVVHGLCENSEAPIYQWRSSNEDFDLQSGNHGKTQWSGFGNNKLCNIKFISPWALKTREAVNFTWTQPTWSQPDTFNRLTALPGVTQFKTQTASHVNYVVEQRVDAQKIHLEPLTPLAIMHPMTERKVKIRHHLISPKKYELLFRRAGGMLLEADEDSTLDPASRVDVRNKKFWQRADELNKCPFE
jgi:hypothetical protein